eukprot:4932115-Prorocentrum_lima.AAC.1
MLQLLRHTAHKTTYAINASCSPHAWCMRRPSTRTERAPLDPGGAHLFINTLLLLFSRVERSGKN